MPYAADLALEEAAESLEYPVHRVDLARVTTKEAFLAAVGEALAFPDWYGHNWDALADCLTDLSWMAADGYVIVLDHADTFAAASPTDFATALSIFQDAADTWREDNIPFWTLVGTASGDMDWMQDLA
ncbi:barstar family protein [Zoogloea sp.]|uniref:barstar family protein n=1 Tax=Zoogloea sp. TaxID=49181 RepID=UPI0035B20DE2